MICLCIMLSQFVFQAERTMHLRCLTVTTQAGDALEKSAVAINLNTFISQ